MKTSELTGVALRWAVADAEGYTSRGAVKVYADRVCIPSADGDATQYTPDTDWAQGGPIIEREGIAVADTTMRGQNDAFRWDARIQDEDAEPWLEYGPTPLVAAMRCFVASKLGDDVEIPKELL